MNQGLINIGTLLQNPHFRYPAIVVIGIEIAKVWLPTYKPQLEATQKIVMFYLVAAAANSTPAKGDAQPAVKSQSEPPKP